MQICCSSQNPEKDEHHFPKDRAACKTPMTARYQFPKLRDHAASAQASPLVVGWSPSTLRAVNDWLLSRKCLVSHTNYSKPSLQEAWAKYTTLAWVRETNFRQNTRYATCELLLSERLHKLLSFRRVSQWTRWAHLHHWVASGTTLRLRACTKGTLDSCHLYESNEPPQTHVKQQKTIEVTLNIISQFTVRLIRAITLRIPYSREDMHYTCAPFDRRPARSARSTKPILWVKTYEKNCS